MPLLLKNYFSVHFNQNAAVMPQTALKNTTSSGVSRPSSRPITPLSALTGKTINS